MASLPVTSASSLSAAMPVVTAGSFQVVKSRSGVVVWVFMAVPSVSGKAPDDPTSPSWPPGAFFSTGKQGRGRGAKRGSDLCCVWISDDAQHRRELIGIRLRIPYAAPGASAWRSERPLLHRPQAGPSSVPRPVRAEPRWRTKFASLVAVLGHSWSMGRRRPFRQMTISVARIQRSERSAGL